MGQDNAYVDWKYDTARCALQIRREKTKSPPVTIITVWSVGRGERKKVPPYTLQTDKAHIRTYTYTYPIYIYMPYTYIIYI